MLDHLAILLVKSASLGIQADQPATFSVLMRAPTSAGWPQGIGNIVDDGAVTQSLALSPTSSTNREYAFIAATYTLTQPPGGASYFFGKLSGSFLRQTPGQRQVRPRLCVFDEPREWVICAQEAHV